MHDSMFSLMLLQYYFTKQISATFKLCGYDFSIGHPSDFIHIWKHTFLPGEQSQCVKEGITPSFFCPHGGGRVFGGGVRGC